MFVANGYAHVTELGVYRNLLQGSGTEHQKQGHEHTSRGNTAGNPIHPAGISSPADPAFYVLVISVQYMFPALLCPERVPDLIQQLIFIFPDGAVQIFLCICFHARYNLIDINIIPDCPKLRIRKYYFFIFPRSFFIAW